LIATRRQLRPIVFRLLEETHFLSRLPDVGIGREQCG
jgi:hypothetical protein